MSNKKLKRRIKELEKFVSILGDVVNSDAVNSIIDAVNHNALAMNQVTEVVNEHTDVINRNAATSMQLAQTVEDLISKVSLMPSLRELDNLKRIWLQRYDDATLRITLLEEAEPVKAAPAKRRPSYDPKVAL